MLDGLRWTSIAACFYFGIFTFGFLVEPQSSQSASPDSQFQSTGTLSPSTQRNSDSDSDPLAGNAAAQRVVSATERWLAGTMSTPGMTAELREISRGIVKGKLEAQYHIFVSGVPRNQTFTLVDWPPNALDPSPSIAGLSVMEDGLVVCAGRATDQCSHPDKPEKKDVPVKLVFYPLKGEIYRLALVSKDQNSKVFFAVMPNPIRETANGCALEAVSLRLRNELVLIRGKGFQPSESVVFESKSYEQTRTRADKAAANGEYQLAMEPLVKGHEGGTAEVKLTGAKCAPILKFQWGN